MSVLELGTINIQDKEIEKFIKTKTIDEIKIMIVTLLKNEVIATTSKPQKGKWAKVADKFRGTMDNSTSEHLISSSKEIRNGFELKDLTVNK